MPALAAGELKASPNPFNPAVRVSFAVPRQEEVLIQVFSMSGQLIAGERLRCSAGAHTRSLNFAGLPSGVYLVRVRTQGVAMAEKVTYIW